MNSSDDQAHRFTAAHWGAYRVTEQTGQLELQPLEDDPAPSRIGRGWLSAASDRKARIARPAIRKGWLQGNRETRCQDDEFVEVSWDEALEHVSTQLQQTIARHGNEAIYGGSYGWASAGRFHHAQSQLRRFLNLIGGYVAARDTYSHAAGEVLLPRITGLSNRQFEEGLTSWPLIADNCSLFLAFGGVSARTAQIASGGTSRHEPALWMSKAANNGMKSVCISPLRSDLETLPGSRWLPVRPGSDVALMLALCHELFTNGWHDETFLNRYTSGWQHFRDYVTGRLDQTPKSAQWASQRCDLSASRIQALARELTEHKVMVSVAWGLQRADHGEQAIWAGLALACLLGQIGQPGCGFGFGYGSTTPPGRNARFLSWPSVPQGRNPVERFIPVARLADMLLEPGGSCSYDGQILQYPDIRLVYWAGGNPFHHHQDLLKLERAWQTPETIIVHDHSWTATARRADIVLPCTTPLEREDIMINRRDPELIFMSQVLPVIAEARNDHDIFADLANRLGIGKAFTEGRSTSQWLRWLWQGCRDVAREEGFELSEFDTFQRKGREHIADEQQTRVLFDSFVADPESNPLNTESGRLTLFNEQIADMHLSDCPPHPAWLEPQEWTFNCLDDQLHLVSQQPDTRLHSQLDNGKESKSSKHLGREVCTLHVEAARRRGLVPGDIVRLHNQRGSCLAALETSEALRQDVVVLPTGAWLDMQETPLGRIDMHGNPNVLTIDKGCSGLSQGNISHTALVSVSRWNGALPDRAASLQPRFSSTPGDSVR